MARRGYIVNTSTDCYTDVWLEPQNIKMRDEIRAKLRAFFSILLTLQPGDGTRYEFLLTPSPIRMEVSDDGREPKVSTTGDVLYISLLNGLGTKTGSTGPRGRVHARLLQDDLGIKNKCTAAALAEALNTVWIDPTTLGGGGPS